MPSDTLSIPRCASLECVRGAYRAYRNAQARSATGLPLRVATWQPIYDFIQTSDTPRDAFEDARSLVVQSLHAIPPDPAAIRMVHAGIACALGARLPAFDQFNAAVFSACELAFEGDTLAAFVPQAPARGRGPLAAAADVIYTSAYARIGALWGCTEQALPRAIAAFSVLLPQHVQLMVTLDADPGLTALRVATYMHRCRGTGAREHASAHMAAYLTPDAMTAIHRFVMLEGGWAKFALYEGLMTQADIDAQHGVPPKIREQLACYLLHLMAEDCACEPEAMLALMLQEDVKWLVASLRHQRGAFMALLKEVETYAVAAGVEATLRHAYPSDESRSRDSARPSP